MGSVVHAISGYDVEVWVKIRSRSEALCEADYACFGLVYFGCVCLVYVVFLYVFGDYMVYL